MSYRLHICKILDLTSSGDLVAKSFPTLATPWTVACQAPLSMEFPRKDYWNGSPFSPPEFLLDPGIEPASSVSPALARGFFITEPPGKRCLFQY